MRRARPSGLETRPRPRMYIWFAMRAPVVATLTSAHGRVSLAASLTRAGAACARVRVCSFAEMGRCAVRASDLR